MMLSPAKFAFENCAIMFPKENCNKILILFLASLWFCVGMHCMVIFLLHVTPWTMGSALWQTTEGHQNKEKVEGVKSMKTTAR